MRAAIVRKARLAWGRRPETGSAAGTGDAQVPTVPADVSIEDWARLGGGLASADADLQCVLGGTATGGRGIRYPGYVVSPSP
ncbi:hypothetical protein C0214_09270 [Methylobacterium sp. DM1]|uniref:Uncharacterized protein n=2 Tax=Methylorubrum TaxID=2282523 RepID=A0AA40S5R6_9HYPH|nr:hypothetical protein C0214_09270 [Methylobacterium sp. DM1]MBA8915018.1 hypothetical protein [Methylorubrum thiocyanatum]GJE74907.1 hypothetical protein BGCPKDLD_1481 [Methylorubrum suomiense]GJE79425.1 hypothetical protein CJNNKLLH_0751 [Methylorubrum thiocyanatum]